MSEPEWTRVRPSLNQKSVIDYVIADNQLMRESGVVQVDRTDIGASDHYLVWLELGRTTKHSRKGKRVIRKWRLGDDGVKLKYIMALQAEVSRFSESIQSKVASGMVGSTLVMNVLADWESIVNEVAKAVVGEKLIVCGRAARWWDAEVKAKIEHRRDVYRKIAGGQDELWEEYYMLCKEVKNLVIEKKLNNWNEVLEKANSDYDGNRKEFWAFVGRRTKGRKRAISALRNNAGVSITSTKGKLRIFQSHYQDLGSKSVDDAFDEDWKQEVESKIRECCNTSSACEDSILDREIEPSEIARCLHSLKNNKTGGSDGLVGELLKYGGSGMVNLLHQLFSVVWHAELVPPQWTYS